MTKAVILPEASPRDVEVQQVVLQLVEAFAFSEAEAVLKSRLAEIVAQQQTHLERLFLDWSNLPPEERPDFLTYAHHRRDPQLADTAESGLA